MRTIDLREDVPIEAASPRFATCVALVTLLVACAGLASGAAAANDGPAPPTRLEPLPGWFADANYDEERVFVRVMPVGAAQATDFFSSDMRILAHLNEGPVEASVTSAQADVIVVRIDANGEEQYELKSLDGSETGIRAGERVELAAVPTDVPTTARLLTPGAGSNGAPCR